MLKGFRDNLKHLGWVLWLVIIAFVLIEFGIFRSSAPGGGGAADAAAYVGDEPISYTDFEQAYRRMETFYKQAYGERFNSDFARQIGLPTQVLDGLIADRILLLEAERLKLDTTDEEIRKEILSLPAFQDEAGQFIGTPKYERLLRSNGLSIDDFEAGLRKDLLVSKVRKLLSENSYVSDEDVENEYRQQVERAKVRFVQLPYDQVEEVSFDEAAVSAFFAENQESFKTPERRVADHLIVDVNQLRTSLAISDKELRDYYQNNEEEFDVPEQLRARHILLQVNDNRTAEEARSILESAKERITGGEDFALLAEELSEDPGSKDRGGDLGFFGRGAMVPAFDEASFSTPPGQMVGPIETDFGYHLIEVLEKNSGGRRAFEEVQENIRERLLGERAQAAAEQKATDLAQRAKESGGELSALAEEESGVSYQTTDSFARDDNLPGIGRATPFAQAAFSLSSGEVSEPVRIARGWAILRVLEIHEPAIPELADVRPEVEAGLRQKLQRDAASETLSAQRDQGLDLLAAGLDLTVEEVEPFARGGTVGTLGLVTDLTDAAFESEQGSLLGPFLTDGGAVLAEVIELTKMDPVEFESQKQTTRDALATRRASQLVASLVGQRRQELEVRYDPNLLANFGIEQPSA